MINGQIWTAFSKLHGVPFDILYDADPTDCKGILKPIGVKLVNVGLHGCVSLLGCLKVGDFGLRGFHGAGFPGLLGRIPLGGIVLGDIEALIETMFHGQLEFAGACFPGLTCAHGSAAYGFTVRPFEGCVLEVVSSECLGFGDHDVSLGLRVD